MKKKKLREVSILQIALLKSLSIHESAHSESCPIHPHFIENISGVFPHTERRIYTYLLSVAASALLLRSIFPFETVLRAAHVF